ncbi:hypothetical protein EXIGLDRAFT_248537 [Exidia glandulosa HHB12029]|uniref:Uncharacterized protein n=1 Tax=Exidia glandulosa HHB12029 TaxID=1314781 RepID=A0A165MFS0_EXIGL|nr:hypothetical protein EXIGLDRAFT_248537 [Exidia glandulosa HHB12029]
MCCAQSGCLLGSSMNLARRGLVRCSLRIIIGCFSVVLHFQQWARRIGEQLVALLRIHHARIEIALTPFCYALFRAQCAGHCVLSFNDTLCPPSRTQQSFRGSVTT